MDKNFFDYLVATDELDEFLGYEPNCPNCGNKLVEYKDNKEIKYHCNNCNKDYTKELKEITEEDS